MKLMDRYLIKGFLKPFGACVLIFCILVVLGRFFDKMGIFTAYHARIRDIAVFLLYGLPLWLNMVLPMATMLAVLFAVGQHQQNGEVTALRGAGIPTWRFFAPYFMIGLVLSIFSLVGGLTFLPQINYKARTVYRVRIKHEDIGKYKRDHVVAAGQNHRRYTIGWLDLEKNEMQDVVMDQFDDNGHLMTTISALKALYDRGSWVFQNGKMIVYDPAVPGVFKETNFRSMVVPIAESITDFALQDKMAEDMTAHELDSRIHRMHRLGVPTAQEEVDLQMKIALAFAHLIVIALALPFALQSNQKGKIQTFGYALGVAFIYWGTASACQSFGGQGHLPPWLAAWMANLIFGVLAVFLLRRV
jgi:lipopolysaccharide export system permease protein